MEYGSSRGREVAPRRQEGRDDGTPSRPSSTRAGTVARANPMCETQVTSESEGAMPVSGQREQMQPDDPLAPEKQVARGGLSPTVEKMFGALVDNVEESGELAGADTRQRPVADGSSESNPPDASPCGADTR